jgi:hypothetical protein
MATLSLILFVLLPLAGSAVLACLVLHDKWAGSRGQREQLLEDDPLLLGNGGGEDPVPEPEGTGLDLRSLPPPAADPPPAGGPRQLRQQQSRGE